MNLYHPGYDSEEYARAVDRGNQLCCFCATMCVKLLHAKERPEVALEKIVLGDCANVCTSVGNILSHQVRPKAGMYEVCARICERCAEVCHLEPASKVRRNALEACRQTAESLRRLAELEKQRVASTAIDKQPH